jgi:hypothetical protein
MAVNAVVVGGVGNIGGTGASVTTSSGTSSATGSDFSIYVVWSPTAAGNADLSTVQDSFTNTWVQKGTTSTSPNGDLAIAEFVALNGTGGASHTATANFVNANGFASIYLVETTGSNHTVDVAFTQGLAAGAGQTYPITSGVLAQATEGVVVFCAVDTGTTATYTSTNFTILASTNGSSGAFFPVCIGFALPGTTASTTYTFTYPDFATHQSAQTIIAFEQAGSTAPSDGSIPGYGRSLRKGTPASRLRGKYDDTTYIPPATIGDGYTPQRRIRRGTPFSRLRGFYDDTVSTTSTLALAGAAASITAAAGALLGAGLLAGAGATIDSAAAQSSALIQGAAASIDAGAAQLSALIQGASASITAGAGALTGSGALGGAAATLDAAAGALLGSGALAGAAATIDAAAGDLEAFSGNLGGAAATIDAAAGALTGSGALAGAAASIDAAAGQITALVGGAGASVSSAAGALLGSGAIAGASASVTAAAAGLLGSGALAGAGASIAAAAGAGSLSGIAPLAGAAASIAAAAGSLGTGAVTKTLHQVNLGVSFGVSLGHLGTKT